MHTYIHTLTHTHTLNTQNKSDEMNEGDQSKYIYLVLMKMFLLCINWDKMMMMKKWQENKLVKSSWKKVIKM